MEKTETRTGRSSTELKKVGKLVRRENTAWTSDEPNMKTHEKKKSIGFLKDFLDVTSFQSPMTFWYLLTTWCFFFLRKTNGDPKRVADVQTLRRWIAENWWSPSAGTPPMPLPSMMHRRLVKGEKKTVGWMLVQKYNIIMHNTTITQLYLNYNSTIIIYYIVCWYDFASEKGPSWFKLDMFLFCQLCDS